MFDRMTVYLVKHHQIDHGANCNPNYARVPMAPLMSSSVLLLFNRELTTMICSLTGSARLDFTTLSVSPPSSISHRTFKMYFLEDTGILSKEIDCLKLSINKENTTQSSSRVSQGGSLFPCSLPFFPYVPMFPQLFLIFSL